MLNVETIFTALLEWPRRSPGSENEMMARETLVTHLEGEAGVDTVEEAFYAPANHLSFFALMVVGQLFALWTASIMPYIALLVGVVFWVSYLLFVDGRRSPFVWPLSKNVTANLVAKKGTGQRLFILMAHLDSAPASALHRPEYINTLVIVQYFMAAIMGLGVLVPLLYINAMGVPVSLEALFSLLLVSQYLILSFDFWKFGYTPGANDNASGVAAATSAASHLWRRMPENAEVRLVITSANKINMLGAQQYWHHHRDEFQYRDVYVVNFDTVGCHSLQFLTESGAFTSVFYQNSLTETAYRLAKQNDAFKSLTAGSEHREGVDSVWFERDNIPSITLTSCDGTGDIPHIHTEQDVAGHVDLDQVALSSKFGEALVRMVR